MIQLKHSCILLFSLLSIYLNVYYIKIKFFKNFIRYNKYNNSYYLYMFLLSSILRVNMMQKLYDSKNMEYLNDE